MAPIPAADRHSQPIGDCHVHSECPDSQPGTGAGWADRLTLHPNEYAGRLEDFRQGVFAHLVGMERPEPTRLRLLLAADTDPEAVRELLVREQGCCAFLSFTITPGDGRLVADLEVPAEAAPALDGMVSLAELPAPGVAR